MKYPNIPIFILTAAMSASTLAVAEDDDDELEFEEAFLYFELNDTDGDLGIHGKADGDAWEKVKIEGPNDRIILDIEVKSTLKRQGLTELFFESAEPTFDELDPGVFFDRFPEGLYEWEGKTLDKMEIEGEVFLSQRIPAAPVVSSVGDDTAPADDECWDPGEVDEVVISWEPVTHTHASLGADTNAPLGDNSVIYYEFVAEVDETEFKSTALITPDTTSWTVSEEFIEMVEGLMVEDEDTGMEVPVDEIKFEIIVRVETGEHEEVDDDEIEIVASRPGNQSAVESCFDI
jgi:hypothetical protein